MQLAIDARSVVAQRTGIGQYAKALVVALARASREHSMLLLVTNETPAIQGLEVDGRIQYEYVPSSTQRSLRRTIWENASLPQLLRARGIDLFHNPTPLLPLLPLHCAAVVTVPDTTPFDMPAWYATSIGRGYRFRVRRSIETADLVIALSDSVRDDVLRLFHVDRHRVVTIYLAADSRFGPNRDARASARLRERYPRPFVLCVGDVMPRKNHVRLIESFDQVSEQYPSVELVIAGRRGLASAAALAAAQAARGRDRIRFVEYVSEDDLPELYRMALLLAFPSLSEGFGLPLIEAMASGLPVLASNRSALPEVAGDAALLVDPENVADIADGLGRLLGDEALRSDLARRGLLRSSHFDWATTAARTLDVYEQAVENHHGRRMLHH